MRVSNLPTKTKVLIFLNTRESVEFNFMIDNTPIETVNEYKYLGITISNIGSFNKAILTVADLYRNFKRGVPILRMIIMQASTSVLRHGREKQVVND